MKKNRLLSLLAAFAATGFLTACDFGGGDDDSGAPEIKEFSSANFDEAAQVWGIGEEIDFWGSASDDNGLKQLKLEVLKGTAVVYTSTKNVSGTSVDFGEGEAYEFLITNPGTWGDSGAYVVRMTAIDGDNLSSSKSMNVKIKGTGAAALKDTTVALGGSGSALPSFLDIDAMATYSATAAPANSAKIDLRFNNTSDNKNEIRSPSSDASLTWPTKNVTKYHKVAAGTYAAANTSAAVTAAYVEASATSNQLLVADGDEIAIKTTAGKVTLLKITITKNSGAPTVEFSVKGLK